MKLQQLVEPQRKNGRVEIPHCYLKTASWISGSVNNSHKQHRMPTWEGEAQDEPGDAEIGASYLSPPNAGATGRYNYTQLIIKI